jgi:alpha-beta hydrolase superfamily lysophospholipase
MPRRLLFITLAAAAVLASAAPLVAETLDTVTLRGHPQTVHLYGSRESGYPVIVSSGDGGWMHLGPQVAQFLASNGFFVVGFDVRAYLESFTSRTNTLDQSEEPGDYRTLIAYAAHGTSRKPILIGVSEGAGLSLLAATDPKTKPDIAGVIGLGLPDLNELGWRLKDAVIYVTHGLPNEPQFSAAAIASRVAPVPLAAIHSTHDEFVPVADVQKVIAAASEPKRLWVIEASNHRFSGSLPEFEHRLTDAVTWIVQHQMS